MRFCKEERFVPVAKSGDRWGGRSKKKAQECLRDYPDGGYYSDGQPWDGITHIEREVRVVSEWVVQP